MRKLLSVWIAATVLALSLSGCSLFMKQVGTRDEHGDVIYNDMTYRLVGVPYSTIFPVGEALGKLEGGSVLYSVKGDDNRDYVVLRWWDGCSLYQKGDTVREGGDEVTALYLIGARSNRQVDITVDDPEDVALLTFDNYPFSMLMDPTVTAVEVDMYDMGVNAARFVLQRIRKPNLRTQSYVTSPCILEREST